MAAVNRKPAPNPADRMPPGYCMFVCDKCGCHSRWYAPVEQARFPLSEILAGQNVQPEVFDHWCHVPMQGALCSACAKTLPYMPEPVKGARK